MIDSLNAINKKRIPENENPNKIIDIVEKSLGFNKQHNSKGSPSDLAIHIKILTPKKMLQRLPIALAQVNTGNTS